MSRSYLPFVSSEVETREDSAGRVSTSLATNGCEDLVQ
ncbi:hypothetical protein M2333_002859 [Sphingobium sp. B11D3B]|nr:hypothetical protein [Sphingobium sp. B11D3B]